LPYFFAGDGEAFAVGLADAVGDGLTLGAAVGETLGAAAGSAVAGEGDGVAVAPESLTTDRGPVMPGNEKISASSIKTIAAMIVAFSSGFCAPRGPKAVWLPAPPKAAATSPPLPDCSSTTSTRNKQARI
jgi:hypothetical protein